MRKAEALATFTPDDLRTSDVGRALSISLAMDLVSLDQQPFLVHDLPTVDGGREREIAYAYLEWLHMEKRLLSYQLFPGIREADRLVPASTEASNFHFPADCAWHEAPMPSTRAESVLTQVGVDLSRAGR